ncbi:hypothetical protein [Moraxella lacunata]
MNISQKLIIRKRFCDYLCKFSFCGFAKCKQWRDGKCMDFGV